MTSPQASILARADRWGRNVLTLNRRREYKALLRTLSLQPSDTLLDVGSGDGFWTVRFAGRSGRTIGVDPDPSMLAYARRMNPRQNVTYIEAAGEHLPFLSHSFDKVVSVSALEHFRDPVAGIREMVRVLKPGGRLALSVDSLLPENAQPEFRQWHQRRHYVTKYFKQEELVGIMRAQGLQSIAGPPIHLFTSRAAAGLRQMFIRRPRAWVMMFPLFYAGVRLSDLIWNDQHGQIVIVGATR